MKSWEIYLYKYIHIYTYNISVEDRITGSFYFLVSCKNSPSVHLFFSPVQLTFLLLMLWILSLINYFSLFFQVFLFSCYLAMAPHSSTLAWKIPWTEEPDRLQSMGSPRVGHDWATSLSLFTFMHWRRKWQPTPVFLLGKPQGWGRLVGCHLWGHTESDMTEVT